MCSQFVGTKVFPRMFQWNNYTCMPKSVYACLTYFDVGVEYRDVLAALNSSRAFGTSADAAIRYMRRFNLRVKDKNRLTWRCLRRTLYTGGVVIAYLDGDHVGVIHGVCRDYVYLADPSILRAPFTRVAHSTFHRRWEGGGIIVQ